MPPKGKQATKGIKQIKQENTSTINFYSTITITSYLPYTAKKIFWDQNILQYSDWSLLFSIIIFVVCYKIMQSMNKSNLDLGMKDGMGEHVKDVILVTSICLGLGTVSLYFWFIWLVIPIVSFYKLWINILAPWIFQEQSEPTEKQRKKMERKMRR